MLAINGFDNTKRNDYFNVELGIILEDMHDENIIVNSNTLLFYCKLPRLPATRIRVTN